MPFILRKIRKSRWYDHNDISWLSLGELQADALNDLETEDNRLSVWHIEDNKSNLDQVITALALNSDSPSIFDFALVDLAVLQKINAKVEPVEAQSPYAEANRWHCDLFELTGRKRLDLAEAMSNRTNRQRYKRSRVLQLAIDAVAAEKIKISELSQSWQKEIRKRTKGNP